MSGSRREGVQVLAGGHFRVMFVTWGDAGWRAWSRDGRDGGVGALRGVLGVFGFGPTPDAIDIVIAVLRHQLVVLSRHVARPR
jgi:hypothetical protein